MLGFAPRDFRLFAIVVCKGQRILHQPRYQSERPRPYCHKKRRRNILSLCDRPDGNIWAPDIQLIDGRYVLYYSKSKWGGEWECGIGVAVADSPEGPISLNMMDITTLSVRQEHAATGSEAPIVWLWPGRKTFLGHT